MEEIIFFKSDTTEARGFCTTPDGKIDFPRLGLSMGLEPRSIELRGVTLPFDSNLHSLSRWTQIKKILGVEGTFENPVVVSGRPAVPTVPTSISLSERRKCGFEFSKLNTWKSGEVVDTTEIAYALEKFGGFPRQYYVRLEETMVFRNCLNTLGNRSERRAVIVGSPGVGKSVLLVLFAFYLAHVQSKSVIILRKLKQKDREGYACVHVSEGYACVHVSEKGSSGSRLNDLAAYHGIRSSLLSDGFNLEKTSLFLDGFTQGDVNRGHGILGGFTLLATSSQYIIKGDDGHTQSILLPAWRSEDLRLFADRMRTFSPDASPDGSELSSEEFEEKFQHAYSYSGGSLREFLRDDVDRENLFRIAMNRISGDAVHSLLSKYGAGSNLQLDTIRKLYVTDPSNVEHYTTVSEYIPFVDSTVALGELRDRFSEEDFQRILTGAESIGGSFLGLAFEWHIHKTASCDRGLTVKAWSDTDKSVEVVFKVDGGAAVQLGESVKECHQYLRDTWIKDDSSKYWFPKMLNYPNIDAIAKCQREGDKVEECLVYFQITTAGSHDLSATKLNNLDDIFKDKFTERKYIALLPEKASMKDFKITGDPDRSRVPLFIGKLLPDTRKRRKTL